MKKSIISAALVLGFAFAGNAMADDCNNPVFAGLTANHTKEVTVCLNNDETLRYTFGKVNQKPEMDLTVGGDKASWASQSTALTSISEVNIVNGKTVYNVAAGSDDEGQAFAMLTVRSGAKVLATIKLDPKTVYNDVGLLADTNIPETDEL